LEEAVRRLGAYAGELDMDPAALEESAARLDALKRLRKKYGEDETAVIAFLERAKDELALLEESGFSEEELAAALAAAEGALMKEAGALSKVRARAAKEFAASVTKHARELAMEKAEFEVRISPKPVEADGADAVEFYFSANPGDPPRPMAKVASGGEISRIMLAIKVASAGRAGVPTLVFDEVDSGLGGRAAAVTATKLQQLARYNQVLVISHLPQIAGRADTHFRIEKGERSGRSSTSVVELEGDARVLEVARMLAGEKVGDSALANARELIG
jgi:DNA repair protein RecN (Recombination protein N)